MPVQGLIDRRDLVEALDHAVLSRVTIISAPAGSGKTSLLRAWAAHPGRGRKVAFMSVRPDQQDALVRAWRGLGSFRSESALGTWLYRLAMNHCLDVLRSRQARMGQSTDSLDEEDAAPVASPAPALSSTRRDTAASVSDGIS